MLLVGTVQEHPCICFRVLYRSEGRQRSRSRYRYSCTRGIRRQASSLSCRACKLSSGRQEDRTIGTRKHDMAEGSSEKCSCEYESGWRILCQGQRRETLQMPRSMSALLQTPARSCRPLLASSKHCDRPHPARHLIQRPSSELLL